MEFDKEINPQTISPLNSWKSLPRLTFVRFLQANNAKPCALKNQLSKSSMELPRAGA
jgi:hypothetical protein